MENPKKISDRVRRKVINITIEYCMTATSITVSFVYQLPSMIFTNCVGIQFYPRLTRQLNHDRVGECVNEEPSKRKIIINLAKSLTVLFSFWEETRA